MFTFLSDRSAAQTPPGPSGGTTGVVPAVPRSVVVAGNSEQGRELCLSESSWWGQEEGGRGGGWGEWDRKWRRRRGVRNTGFRQKHLADFQWRESRRVDPVRRKPVITHISMWAEELPVPDWTPIASCFREADRAILMACQQRGASWKTFRHVSAQLGNKTAKQVRGGGASLQPSPQWFIPLSVLQVSLRFQDLMKLFHSAFQNSHS